MCVHDCTAHCVSDCVPRGDSNTRGASVDLAAASHSRSVATGATTGTRARPHCLHECLPVLHALGGALAGESHHAAFGLQRRNGIDAQFDGLFDEPIHLVAAGNALRKRDGVARFGVRLRGVGKAGGGIALVDGVEPRAEFVAGAIEEADVIASGQAQYVDVARDGLVQRDGGVGGERRIDEKTGKPHYCNPCCESVRRSGDGAIRLRQGGRQGPSDNHRDRVRRRSARPRRHRAAP